MTNEELWQAALSEIEFSISKPQFITWFKNTFILSFDDGRITIGVPNGFAKEWLENKFNVHILRALRNLDPSVKSINCTIIAPQENTHQKNALNSEQTQQISHPVNKEVVRVPSESNLNLKYSFDNFVIGSNNELARAACYAVSQNLGRVYNPLFIYGGVGLGKTHLIQSIGNEVVKNNPALKVIYITSERFTDGFINSVKAGKISEFKTFYQQVDLLIIDDIQFISGKEKTQEEFFHIFNHLYQLNKQIVISSDRAPKAIQILEERLRSRFEGGMIADVGKPDYEIRMAILQKKVSDEGLNIDADALEFIAHNIKNNIRELEGALNRISVSAQLSQSRIDLDYVSKSLAELISSGKKKGISYKSIIKTVSDFYEVNPTDLLVKNRKQDIVKPRQITMYLMRTELLFSFPGIGEKIGKRDHSTAMHAYEKISQLLEKDEKLREEINLLRDQLYSV